MAVAKLDVVEQFFDNDGNPLNGGLLYTYQGGTTTPLAVYTDSTGNTAHANPVVLDSAGRPPGDGLWYTAGVAVKIVPKTSAGVTLDTIDNVVAPDTSAAEADSYFHVILTYPGGPPSTEEWLGGERVAVALSFPANFAGSYGKAPKTNPAGSFVVTAKKNGVTIGTATCSTGGLWTFATTSGAVQSLTAGDELDFYGPASADANMADFGLTLVGELV